MSTTPKEIIFDEEARELLAKGIKTLAEIVGVTLGPKGRNVGLEKSWGTPTITNDGSSIVKDISLKNVYENMGVQMAKEAVQKIKEKCGDGTTTATILLNAMVENGIKYIAAGASPISLKRGMEKAVDAVIKEIEKNAIPVKGSLEIRNIATVSASGHEEIGAIIAEAMEKAKESGVITIEEAKGTETTIELVEGMQFDRGYLSSYFCTNQDRLTVEMHHAKILLVNHKISNIHEILPILQATATSGQELLIIAEDIEGDALSTLVINKLSGRLKVAAVKSPGFGDRRKAMLEDIAALTGANVISNDAGIALKDITIEHLGNAEKVSITKENTTLVNGTGTEDAVKARIKDIENEIKLATSPYEKEKLEERKAKLGGMVAIIYVGAPTEPELKQKKQMFEDSLNSTKAALEDGIVPGGGVALLRGSQAISNLNLNGDELLGAKIIALACDAPLKQIGNNAGKDGFVILHEVQKAKATDGFNALTGNIENLIDSGVVDPVKVVKYALTYAASIAGIVLISEALIADAKEDDVE